MREMLAIVMTLLAAVILGSNIKAEVLEPGVFQIDLRRHPIPHHYSLASAHPRVGNWSDTEYWNHVSKLPIKNSNLQNYLYVMDCQIGTINQKSDWSLCAFDSSTSISSVFSQNLADTVIDAPRFLNFDPDYQNLTSVIPVDTLGLNFNGWNSTATWCLGNSDPHTNVCLEKQSFAYLYEQVDAENEQYELPFKYYRSNDQPQAIIGLGAGDPSTDPNSNFNFINRAYEAGLLKNNTYSFQGLTGDEKYASITIGGYSENLFSSEVEWYDLNPSSNEGASTVSSWRLTFSNFTFDTHDLMTPPSSEDSEVYDGALPNADFPVYGHFNTGYPFLGVDPNVFAKIKTDLKLYRPDVNCDFDESTNVWGVCVWEDDCDPNTFGDANWTFAFGTNATFKLPLSTLMINYTASGDSWCAFAVQQVAMPYDSTAERHFYFGDIFFENFAGVFDFSSGKLGMALSAFAPSTVELSTDIEPTPGPDPPSPDPPSPEPQPTPSGDSTESHLMWLWIVIGLAILIMLILLVACYFRRKANQQKRMNLIVASAGIGHDGDLIETNLRMSQPLNDSIDSDADTSMEDFANQKPKMEQQERVFNLYGQGKPISDAMTSFDNPLDMDETF